MYPGFGTVSIIWGAWAVGMAATAAATLRRFERLGMGAITPARGLAALAHVLATASAPPTAEVSKALYWTGYRTQVLM